jgi:4-amino-4-deoxy-L-arabinose transferase-like glycosyltransferase
VTFRPLARLLAQYRRLVARGLALQSVVCMLLSAYAFRPQLESLIHYRPTSGPQDYYDPAAPWLALAGGLALIAALLLSGGPTRLPRRAAPRLDALWPRRAWLLLLPGVLMLLAVSEINGKLIGVKRLGTLSPHVQFALLVGGIGLTVLGLAGLPRSHRPFLSASPEATAPPGDRAAGSGSRGGIGLEIALVLAITLLALGVRFWKLGESVRLMVDEGHFALGVTYFWTFPNVKLLEPMPTSASFPFIFSYGQAGMVAIFGRNFLGLRALSAVLGALTVPALYLLTRELFDRLAACMAALVLLTFPPQVQYSRLALNNIADPLFGTLALAFLARGLRTRRRMDYVLSGVMLGLTQYFYEGGRLLFPALAAAWMVGGLVLWRPRPSLRGLALAALAFMLVAAPVYYTLVGLHFPLTNRLDATELSSNYWEYRREANTLETRLAHFKHSLLFYVSSPENTMFHYFLYYGGQHPLILEPIVPAFLLGLVIALWRWRTPGVLPLLWLLGTSLGNAMIVESAVSARYVVVFPALALLIALGIRYTLPLIWPWRGQAAIMLALAGIIAIGQATFYFGPFLDLFNREVRANVAYDVDDAMLRAQHFPPGTQVYIVADQVLPETDAQRLLNFLADHLTVLLISPDQFATVPLANLPRSVDYAFFVVPGDGRTIGQLVAAFGPHDVQPSTTEPLPEKGLALFYVPAQP